MPLFLNDNLQQRDIFLDGHFGSWASTCQTRVCGPYSPQDTLFPITGPTRCESSWNQKHRFWGPGSRERGLRVSLIPPLTASSQLR